MSDGRKRKQSLYIPEAMLREIAAEATRMDRSLSWMVQRAWLASRTRLMTIPSANEPPRGNKDEGPVE